MTARAAIALCAVLLGAAAAPDTSAYRTTATALAGRSNGAHLDGKPGAKAVLSDYWVQVRDWCGQWLAANPAGSSDQMTAAAKQLDPDLAVRLVRLDRDDALVSASNGGLGTVVIMKRTGARYNTAWTIEGSTVPPGLPEASTSRSWSSDDDRPLYATAIGRLDPLRSGVQRFYVNGYYAREIGATGGNQLSVWTWDGKTAIPLLIHTYVNMADQDGPRVKANVIRIAAKGAFKQMAACGACVGREMRITVRSDPADGAPTVTERSRVPELDLVDQLYDRLANGRSVADLATAKASRALRAEVKTLVTGHKDRRWLLGLIDAWTLRQGRGRETLCLSTDNSAHAFDLARESGRLMVTRVRDVDPKLCEGPGSRS